MTPPRPAGVTWLCALALIAALIDLSLAQLTLWSPDGPEAMAWIAAHQTGARVQLGLTYFFGTITLLTCYFMLRAKNWARWTYLAVSGIRYVLAFVLLGFTDAGQDLLFLQFRGAMLPGLLLLLMGLFVLFTLDAREYFAGGGRPWWKIEEEEEERARRKAAR